MSFYRDPFPAKVGWLTGHTTCNKNAIERIFGHFGGFVDFEGFVDFVDFGDFLSFLAI